MGNRGRRRRSVWRHRDGRLKWPSYVVGGSSVLVVLAIVFIVAAGYRGSSAQADPEPAYTPREFSFGDDKADVPDTVAILGDSFSPAQDQPVAEYNFAAIAGEDLGWETIMPFGRGGTGYTNPGQAAEGDSVYADRVDAVIAAGPSLVIVQGSTNDHDYAATRAAALDVFARLRAGLPDAQIIALGPLVTPGLGPEAVTPARDAVRDAAAAAGVEFIDPLDAGWLGRDQALFVDAVHPSGDGQRQIAEHFVDAYRSLSG